MAGDVAGVPCDVPNAPLRWTPLLLGPAGAPFHCTCTYASHSMHWWKRRSSRATSSKALFSTSVSGLRARPSPSPFSEQWRCWHARQYYVYRCPSPSSCGGCVPLRPPSIRHERDVVGQVPPPFTSTAQGPTYREPSLQRPLCLKSTWQLSTTKSCCAGCHSTADPPHRLDW